MYILVFFEDRGQQEPEVLGVYVRALRSLTLFGLTSQDMAEIGERRSPHYLMIMGVESR